MANKNEGSVGKAYGFFRCNASKQEIERELPTIREMVRTPSQLELSLTEDIDELIGFRGALRLINPELSELAKEAKQSGINYMLQATYPNGTNRDTADEVASILNQTYQSPLYKAKEPFNGAIVYEEDGKYVFRD